MVVKIQQIPTRVFFGFLLSAVWALRISKVAAAVFLLYVFLILIIPPSEILQSSPLNYLHLEKLIWAELFVRIQVTWGSIRLHEKSDWQWFIIRSTVSFCMLAHLKASLPFPKIHSIMDQAKSIASLFPLIMIPFACSPMLFWRRWANCTLWLWTHLQVNNILPSG